MGCHLSVWHRDTQWRCKGAADTALPFQYSVSTLNLATSGEDADAFFDGITTGRVMYSSYKDCLKCTTLLFVGAGK